MPSQLPLSAKTQTPKSYLYSVLVKNSLGEQAALVITALISHGPLTSHAIHQYSGLPSSNVKQCLVSLVQMECVVYALDNAKCTYSFSETGCMKLLYAGDIISTIHRIYNDEKYSQIVVTILSSGHMTINDYLGSLGDQHQKQELQNAFFHLVSAKWLAPVEKSNFLSKYEIWQTIYQHTLAQYNKSDKSKTSDSKKIQEVKNLTSEKYEKEVLEMNVKNLFVIDQATAVKKVNPNIPLSLSLDRFLKRQRSIQLENLVKHKIGAISAKLYSLMLEKVEKDSMSLFNPLVTQVLSFSSNTGNNTTVGIDPGSRFITDSKLNDKDRLPGTNLTPIEILREVKSRGDSIGLSQHELASSIVDPVTYSLKNKQHEFQEPAPKRVKTEVESDITAILNEQHYPIELEPQQTIEPSILQPQGNGDGGTISAITQHLKLLSSGPLPFLKESVTGKFFIPFSEIQRELQKATLYQYVKVVFGDDCYRVLSCIISENLLEERGLASRVLMKESDLRTIVQKLLNFQIIELQEIPKTQDRAAARTTFCYRHRYDICKNVIKNSIVYNMAEVLSMLEDLKLDNKVLLDKVEREDVKGKEEELLIKSELEQLKTFYDNEMKGLGQFMRLRTAFDCFEFFN